MRRYSAKSLILLKTPAAVPFLTYCRVRFPSWGVTILIQNRWEYLEGTTLLKIKRAQKSTMMGTAVFSLDFKAEISEEERKLIDKYKLGRSVVYSSEAFQKNLANAGAISQGQVGFLKGVTSIANVLLFNLKITINELVDGRHLEMKDLDEMLSAEEQVVQACNNLKGHLSAAKSFDGREVTIEI